MMRSERIFGALQRAFRRSLQRAPEQFRVLHFSIQRDHVHLIVEAANKQALPNDFGSGSTCHLRFQKWVKLGVFAAIHRELLSYYDGRRGIALR